MKKFYFLLVLLGSTFLHAQNFVEDFGSGADTYTLPYFKTEYYQIFDFNNQGDCPPLKPQDGMYIITSNLGIPSEGNNCYRLQGDLFFDSWHKNLTDYSKNSQGRFMVVNGSFSKNIVFERKIEGLEKGKKYNFSSRVANLLNTTNSPCKNQTSNFEVPVILNFEIYEDDLLIYEKSTPNIFSQSDLIDVWKKYELEFEAKSSSHKLVIRNISTSGCGNDFALDDISLNEVGINCDIPWVEIRMPREYEKWDSFLTTVTKENLLFEWTATDGGQINSPIDKNQVNITTPGLYTVKVTNPATGCSNSRSVRLIPEDMNPFFQIIPNENLGCGKDKVKLEIKETYDNPYYSRKWISNIEGIEYTDNPLLIYVTKPGNYMFMYEPLNTIGIVMMMSFEVFDGVQKPIGKSIQYYKKGQTLKELNVQGQNIKWYDSAESLNIIEDTTLLINEKKYFASQSIDGCESLQRLEIQALNWETTDSKEVILFKDAKLKKALVESNLDGFYNKVALNRDGNSIIVDANKNGEIEFSEALNVQELNLQKLGITNLEGLQHFKNLRKLNVIDNQIQDVDLIGLDNLNELFLGLNSITDLDVSPFQNLKILSCSNNQVQQILVHEQNQIEQLLVDNNLLTSLPLSKLIHLKILDINVNSFIQINLSDLKYLEVIDCDENQLTGLDLSKNNLIKHVSCRNNQIDQILFSQAENLEFLFVSNNNLSELDLTLFPKLSHLYADFNNIKVLDFSKNKNTKELVLTNNQLNTLSVTENKLLNLVNASYNELEFVDLDNSSVLETLRLDNNNIKYLNVKGCFKLNDIDASNNKIQVLDLSDQTIDPEYEYFNFQNNELVNVIIKNNKIDSFINEDFFITNTDIKYVCVDSDEEKENIINLLNQLDYSKVVQVNSYCTFNPTTNFSVINGEFNFNNGECITTDYNFNVKIEVQPLEEIYSGYSIVQENSYSLALHKGKYKLFAKIENPEIFVIEPNYIEVDSNTTEIINQNFCISPKGTHNDLEVILTPINAARPGFDASYKIVYKNKGNQTISGQVVLKFQDDLLDYVSTSPLYDALKESELVWNFKDLKPFETKTIDVDFNVNSPMEKPAVNNGDILKYSAQIITTVTDATPEDNAFELEQRVVGSYDPNDKTCLEGDVILPDMVGDYVHYKIRFENTGDYFAENVIIEDFIDATKFDINSLVVLNASHEQKTRIENNKVVFYFQGIKLPATPSPDRHGYVLFKIKTLPTLQLEDTFSNQANIYFDYNWPIQTNKATTTIKEVKGLGVSEFEKAKQIKIYPNPAKEILNISVENEIVVYSIEIYNTLGQLVMLVTPTGQIKTITVNHLPEGVYYVKMNTNKGVINNSFVKE